MYRVKEGEWFRPDMKEHILGCCDCGLMHKLYFRIGYVSGDKIWFLRKYKGKDLIVPLRATRDNRRTALSRRGKQRVKVKGKRRV